MLYLFFGFDFVFCLISKEAESHQGAAGSIKAQAVL